MSVCNRDPIDARVEVLNQRTASIGAKRFELAMREPFEYFICVQDNRTTQIPERDGLWRKSTADEWNAGRRKYPAGQATLDRMDFRARGQFDRACDELNDVGLPFADGPRHSQPRQRSHAQENRRMWPRGKARPSSRPPLPHNRLIKWRVPSGNRIARCRLHSPARRLVA